jgi:hypothetical protein
MGRKKKLIAVCVLLVVAAGVLVWYHLPIKTSAAVELYCDDPAAGELSADFDLAISRSLLSPTEVNGTIRIDGRNYEVWARQDSGFFSNIQRKIDGELDVPVFINEANFGQGTDQLLSDLLYIHSLQFGDGYELEAVSLSLTADDHGMWNSSAA